LEFEIRPYKGFGPIDFGMSREEVEERLGQPERAFPRENGEMLAYDGIHIQFDERGVIGLIESFPPCVAIMHQTRLLGTREKLTRIVRGWGHEPSPDIAGSIIFPDIGVGLWSEDLDGKQVDSVSVSTRRYLEWELQSHEEFIKRHYIDDLPKWAEEFLRWKNEFLQ